jgi:ABC-type transport system substrate-binding protein
MKMLIGTALGLVAVAALAVQPAEAQKSKNTLRTALASPIKGVTYYLDPKPDTAMEQGAVYDGLVWYNGETKKIEPLLAKSWKRIDAKTIEFVLRDDVKWHDGQAFDADDVVYTYNWLTDKKTRMRFKRNWAWVAKTEKLGSHKVRITAKKPTPFDMVRHATLTAIMPEHVHGPLPKKIAFGKKPVGTGMFRVTQVDSNKGIIMELNPSFKHGGPGKPVTNINRIHFAFMPDIGTQVAQFLAGNLDAMRNAPLDQAMSMAKQPGVELDLGASISYQYVAIDAKGRSGNKPLLDLRVRKAIMMAINKDAIVKLAAGPFPIARPEAMCWRIQAGCDYSVAQPTYDPAAAKRLLAEAGYGNGRCAGDQRFRRSDLGHAFESGYHGHRRCPPDPVLPQETARRQNPDHGRRLARRRHGGCGRHVGLFVPTAAEPGLSRRRHLEENGQGHGRHHGSGGAPGPGPQSLQPGHRAAIFHDPDGQPHIRGAHIGRDGEDRLAQRLRHRSVGLPLEVGAVKPFGRRSGAASRNWKT